MGLVWNIVVVIVVAKVLLSLLSRTRPIHVLTIAGLAWFFWPEISDSEIIQSAGAVAGLAELRSIAAEDVVLDAEQCSDEEMVGCYHQVRGQYADQMARTLAVL